MSSRLFLIVRVSIMMAVIALAVIGTIYVLELFKDAEIQKALGKVMALLGIYTGCALVLTLIAGGARAGAAAPGGD